MKQRLFVLLPILFLATARGALAQAITISDPGFETLGNTDNVPSVSGIWGGDLNQVVTAQNGITPLSGSGMLHFVSMAPGGSQLGTGADAVQLVDLSSFSSNITAGNFTVTLSASFNRVSGASNTEFDVYVRSYSGVLSNFPSDLNSFTGFASNALVSDSNAATWEPLSTALLLPTNTTYVAIWVSAISTSNVFSFAGGDDHYADAVVLTGSAIPEPSTYAALLGAAVLGFIGVNRFRRSRAAHA